jgi:hypothetical protein
MAKEKAKVVAVPEKAIDPVEKVVITLSNGQVFELEDLTGYKAIRIVRELGREAVQIGLKIRNDPSEQMIAQVLLSELDDETLERCIGVLFDGYNVLGLKAIHLMELIELYLKELEIAEVFQVAQRIGKMFTNTLEA